MSLVFTAQADDMAHKPLFNINNANIVHTGDGEVRAIATVDGGIDAQQLSIDSAKILKKSLKNTPSVFLGTTTLQDENDGQYEPLIPAERI